ncbi:MULTISPECIES: hypothetical protein [Paenarthrobacter]|uniref:hypothetical protein n=1 Tax=Paenarthrobacter TaxID=1742992 RepID=UPI0022300A24|nr:MULTISPECIES: hypothetical protein [Paenarthrobacter]MCW3766110.1 hypothetical protein [Paenarthrobacter sp. PAE-2]MCX8455640.1 hypothetical protein [Paenarthrobacter ureafaciens]MCY0973781.1 hypothetical protein [Paenarthrobacter ureafaciens]
MTKKRNTVFITMDPNALPARSTKGWEYLLPCDEVEVTLPEGDTLGGLILDGMSDGSGVWVYLDGVGKRFFNAEQNVEIIAVRKVARPEI